MRCSKIISNGIIVDSIARLKKNHIMLNENNLFLSLGMADVINVTIKIRDKIVAGGLIGDDEIGKPYSRLRREGSG